MRASNLNFLIFLAISFDFVSSDQAYGASCTLKSGSSGICADIANCPEIKKLFEEHRIIRHDLVICNKVQRYLCCPLSSDQVENTSSTTTKAPGLQEFVVTEETTIEISTKSEDQGKSSQDESSQIGRLFGQELFSGFWGSMGDLDIR
jgi:hypothetical protein